MAACLTSPLPLLLAAPHPVPVSARATWSGYVLLLALISAASKEVALRGWILNGLRLPQQVDGIAARKPARARQPGELGKTQSS